MKLLIYTFIFLILILLILLHINNKYSIHFLNKEQLGLILSCDKDKFYSSLSKHNLLLRNISDKNLFLQNINKYLYSLSDNEKCIITKAIKKANNILKKIKCPGFNFSKIQKYNWIIGCSIGTEYEFGYPHTRSNIIILNYNNIYDNDLYKTLIHERIHIYQKLFPKDIQVFLDHYKFKKIKLQNEYHLANPDTDEHIYSLDNKDLECIIQTNFETNFQPSEQYLEYSYNDYKLEHPFEFMAYLIAETY